jgi:hypothetical protein
MIYEWEAGTHRPRAYYVLFVLVYATEEELAARTIERGSELERLMAALKAMGVPVNRRQFLLNAAALAGGIAGMPTAAANLEGQERLVWGAQAPTQCGPPHRRVPARAGLGPAQAKRSRDIVHFTVAPSRRTA